MLKNLPEEYEFNIKYYCSIYKLAEIIGRDMKSFNTSSTVERFRQNLDKLPNGIIEMIKLRKKIIVEAKYPPVKSVYSIYSIEKFMKENIKMSHVLKLMNGKYADLQMLVKKYNIQLYMLGKNPEFKFYPRDIIENKIPLFDEKMYINFYQAAEIIGKNIEELKTSTQVNLFMKQMDKLPNKMIEKHELIKNIIPKKGYPSVKYVYNIQSIERFMLESISIRDALKLTNGSLDELLKLVKAHDIPLYELGYSYELMFYPKEMIGIAVFSFDKEIYMNIYELAEKKYEKKFMIIYS